jgi:hypothetical protein
MAKDLDPHKKANQIKKVRAGSMMVNELISVSSGFSLQPESRLSAAAVEAEKHNPKVIGKEEVCRDQGQGNGKEGIKKMKPMREAMGKFMDLSLPSSQQEFCDPSEVLYRKNTPEAMAKASSKQLTDYHNYQKDDFQD